MPTTYNVPDRIGGQWSRRPPRGPRIGRLHYACPPDQEYKESMTWREDHLVRPRGRRCRDVGPVEASEDLAELVQVDRLDQVVVEARLLRAAPVLLLAVAGQGDEQQAAERRARRAARRPPRSRPCPGRPMSSRTTSGRLAAAASSAAGPSWATGPRGPSSRSSMARLVGRVAVVVDDQDRGGRPRAGPARRRPRRRGPPRAPPTARQADDELAAPCPARRSWPRRVPPCSSTRLLDQRQADAQPALRRGRASGRPGRTGRRRAAASPARCRCPCRAPGPRPRRPRARPSSAIRPPGVGVLGGVVQQVASTCSSRVGSASSHERLARRASTVSAWPAGVDQRAGRLDGAADDARPGRPAPCAARSCRA